jgi:hypothetical protein
MERWRVGLREENGQWYAAELDVNGRNSIETALGQTSPGDAVNLLHRELEDWGTYRRARYPD